MSSDLIIDQTDRRFLIDLAQRAGEATLQFYADEVEVERKADNSPLTAADRASHAVIVEGLQHRFPEIPVLSEEGASTPYEERRGWARYFLVDPLDGTKEFIKKNGEFTVNIALMLDGRPRFGVVCCPVLRTTYSGGPGLGAEREVESGERTPIQCGSGTLETPLTVVGSRSHGSPEMEGFLARITVKEFMPVGSSLKFCRVAEGSADVYPRFGPTMEWDTAAAHAVVLGAGGIVVDRKGDPLPYNKESLLNGPFCAASSSDILSPWLAG